MRYIYCIFLYMPLIIDICQSGMEIGLAWCGGASARGFKVRVLRWRSGVAGALLRRGAAVAAGASNRRSRSTRSTRRGSLTLACDSVWALRKQRTAYGCHLPARGGPPTCVGRLFAWWGIGGAVMWRGRFAARCALL